MSERGIPIQVVLAIQQDPQDESSLCGVMIDERQSAVPLFTQRKFADEFARNNSDNPSCAVIAPVEVLHLATVLREQALRGRTHVVTDPIVGSPSYLDQKTLTISEYLKRLGS